MKQEIKDIVYELSMRTAPAGAVMWFYDNFSAIMAAVLVVLQIAFLLRKWWVLETRWGQKLKNTFSKPMELDE